MWLNLGWVDFSFRPGIRWHQESHFAKLGEALNSDPMDRYASRFVKTICSDHVKTFFGMKDSQLSVSTMCWCHGPMWNLTNWNRSCLDSVYCFRVTRGLLVFSGTSLFPFVAFPLDWWQTCGYGQSSRIGHYEVHNLNGGIVRHTRNHSSAIFVSRCDIFLVVNS